MWEFVQWGRKPKGGRAKANRRWDHSSLQSRPTFDRERSVPSVTVCLCLTQTINLYTIWHHMQVKFASWLNINSVKAVRSEFTFKTVSPEFCCWFWEASLVSEAIHGPDAQQASPTLHFGYCDRMSCTAIREPTIVTSVQTLSPGSMELTRGCQHCIFLLTLVTGLFKSHLLGHRSIVNFTWNTESKMRWSSSEKPKVEGSMETNL